MKIKAIRQKKNLTQEEIAKKLGLAQSNYARLERGLSQLTVDRLEEIASIFEMSPEAILTYSEDLNDFKEDAQFYYQQLKKCEAKNVKLQQELQEHQQEDQDTFERHDREKREQAKKIKELEKKIETKDQMLKEKHLTVEKLEKEVDYLRAMTAKLVDLLPGEKR
ncbi:helix-turn-helix domain-containing protein [Dyadobacter sp.]|uniref:helix-turn-helix domain-containing protein n=1 Tax=Dyadobacter sp. TaxID=1914288 RepID=UPI003F705D01